MTIDQISGFFRYKGDKGEVDIAMSTTITSTYLVNGMTCDHCSHAVTTELSGLVGVTGVRVDLVAGGTSIVTVTSANPLADDDVAAALDEAGEYRLAGRP